MNQLSKITANLLIFLPMVTFLNTASADTNNINFLTISDIHLNTKQRHTMQIDPSSYDAHNDMDLATFRQLTSLIKKNTGPDHLIPTPQFILYLGDIVGHQSSFSKLFQNREKFVTTNQKEVLSQLQQTFPNTPIINVFGNNDSLQANYGDYTYQNKSPYSVALTTGFKNGFLSSGTRCNTQTTQATMPCLATQNTEYGFFSIKITPELTLLGLNSVMFSPEHKPNPHALNSQLQFIKNQLATAQKNNVGILIAMHIPAGHNVYDSSAFWQDKDQQQFLNTIAPYHHQIRGILVGHTHMEEFKIIQTAGKAYGEYFTAGLSTSHGNSPSLKLYTLTKSKNNWAISDYTTYQVHKKNNTLELSKYYNFANVYCKNLAFNADINNCLSHITFNMITPRYTVNNPNYLNYQTKSPEAFYVPSL
ncbi:metallophosphoesterase [Piscirickettsia salmonis]|uniref:metallophosphoesterase n=1 Tax=Piscirickettsia salmonis TaxID=1238 RepID=UPI000F081EAF|nr:phosphoesterase [Piscirickettsiaceae bacterium NZ-RLO2]